MDTLLLESRRDYSGGGRIATLQIIGMKQWGECSGQIERRQPGEAAL
ncbi:MAG TPA: hypothetical protein VFE47_22290 [Tepidisphaeraceae bacterium]|jgi:hypothetical protein|nr:hypothetical protein [Tepidisphaeraceae bacterium]